MKTCIHALPSRDRNRWTWTIDTLDISQLLYTAELCSEMVCPLVTHKVSRSFTRRKRCFSARTPVDRISNNLFPRGICNPYAPLVPIARRVHQLYADLFINVCNIYSYPRSTQTVLRRCVINCLYGKVRMELIGYIQFVRYHNSICKCAFVCTLYRKGKLIIQLSLYF